MSYALDFVRSGRFRLGRLDAYQHIEDNARADNSEGMGHYVSPDGISMHFEFGKRWLLLSLLKNADVSPAQVRLEAKLLLR